MKKLYSLSAAFIILTLMAVSAQAQRTANLQTTMKSPSTTGTPTVNVGTPFAFQVEFKNLGPDTLKPTDTLYYTFTGTSSVYFRTGMTKKAGDTMYLNTTLTISNASASSIRFCVYGLFRGPGLTDPTRGNDSSCANLKVNGATGIENVISMTSEPVKEHLTMFPNPAQKNITFDFAARNNSALTATVFDLTGREVMSNNYGATFVGKRGFSLDISNLLPGLYFVELRQDGVRALGKLKKD